MSTIITLNYSILSKIHFTIYLTSSSLTHGLIPSISLRSVLYKFLFGTIHAGKAEINAILGHFGENY